LTRFRVGVELGKHGTKDWAGRCLFHEGDDNPSLIVSPDKGLFHCMGCGSAKQSHETKAVGIRLPRRFAPRNDVPG